MTPRRGWARAGKDGLLLRPLGRILHRQTSWQPVCLCTCAWVLLPDRHKKCTPPCLRKGCTNVRAPRQWRRMSYRYIPWCSPFPPLGKGVTTPERLVYCKRNKYKRWKVKAPTFHRFPTCLSFYLTLSSAAIYCIYNIECAGGVR